MARVMGLITTDWKKDPSKVKMLHDEMTKLERLSIRVNHLAAADTKRFDASFDASLSAMFEVARELERCSVINATSSLNDADLKASLMKAHPECIEVPAQRERMALTRKRIAELAAVDKANAAAGHWATPAMKGFAALLNRERAVVGLNPWRLEEKLCAATRGHCEDMARLGFFSHESPVTGKKSFSDRARLAGFSGNAFGENIFMGSPAFGAAYEAWFTSDGHRFIMFCSEGNVIGVGNSSGHWAMNPGSCGS